jgi:hypothetical protein
MAVSERDVTSPDGRMIHMTTGATTAGTAADTARPTATPSPKRRRRPRVAESLLTHRS